MSDTLFQTAIAEILTRHGADVTNEPIRLRNLLRDYCAADKCRREVNVTVQCAKSGFIDEMLKAEEVAPPAARLNRIVGILHEDYGIDRALARYVVETWMRLFDDADIQNRLGEFYFFGEDSQPDYTAAVKWSSKAAVQGHAVAQRHLGYCYHEGLGVQQDFAEALKWYHKAAEQGNAVAQYNLGLCYQQGQGVQQDFAEALKWYRKAADQGDAVAQLKLGHFYEGRGVQQNLAEAAKWYRKAADQGNAAAQCFLGFCYEDGQGVQQNFAEAAKWYREAADQGNAAAQCFLGFCYEDGRGVQQNLAEALKWYRKAADQGTAVAQYFLGFCYADGQGVQQDFAEAAKWFRKAADQGDSDAQFSLGLRYALGQGVQQDFAEALKWYRKAADQGHEAAQVKLGIRCDKGQGGQLDLFSDALSVVGGVTPKPGDVQTFDLDGGVSLELVWCPAGSYMMGSPEDEEGRSDDEVAHQVTLTKGFWLGKYPVTQHQWAEVMGSDSDPSEHKGSDLPVDCVGWDDCQEFVRKLNEKVQAGNLHPGVFRLPTEAEWEYACRAGTTGPYAGNLDDTGWYKGNSGRMTYTVGRKRANAWGLYDMHGNVCEWCQDWYGDYPSGNVIDPTGPISGSSRVIRGGSWLSISDYCRSAFRFFSDPDGRSSDDIGFRVVLSPMQS